MSTKASNYFDTNPYGTTTEINNVGSGTVNNALDPLLYSGQGESIGELTSDDDWRNIKSVTGSGIINLLWYASIIGLYTSGDVLKIRLTVDGTVTATSQVSLTSNDMGAVFIGGVTNDGTNYRPLACGFVPFKTSFLVEQQVIRAGASCWPNVLLSYIITA